MSVEEVARRRVLAARFGLLAASILLTLAAIVLAPANAQQGVAGELLLAIPVLLGVYVAGRSTRLVAGAAGAMVVAAIVGAVAATRSDPGLLVADAVVHVAVLGAIVAWVVREVLRVKQVSIDTISGAICAYLLLGFLFANVYRAIQLFDPGALVATGQSLDPRLDRPAIFYFSYVTLTTVAYGDITPASAAARLVAIFEGMVGQLYPTIFIARLVSLSITQR